MWSFPNVYTVTAPTSGNYILRYYVETKTESIASQGIITVNATTEDVIHLPAPDSTPIQGLWSRNTTLKKSEPWHVSAVVGLVAPGQQRRSFLAYSERERAVPWHPCVIYNSWYELNIDRNNGLETENYRGNFTEAQCLDVVQQWKKKLFDPYGVSIDVFVWNGTDNTDHPEFDTAVRPVALLADEPDATIYDLQGRKVTSIQKGSLYIQNGKKFMVK